MLRYSQIVEQKDTQIRICDEAYKWFYSHSETHPQQTEMIEGDRERQMERDRERETEPAKGRTRVIRNA